MPFEEEGAAAPGSKVVPMLTAKHELARVTFAKAALRKTVLKAPGAHRSDIYHRQQVLQVACQGQTCWQVMHTSHQRNCCLISKCSIAAHVYMNIYYHGGTSLDICDWHTQTFQQIQD